MIMQKHIAQGLSCVLSLLLLSACSAPPMVAASGPNTAALRLVNLSPYLPVQATTLPGENCNMMGSRSIVNDPVSGDKLGPKKSFDTRIPAGQIFNVHSWLAQPNMTCSVTVSFMPQPGREYVMSFDAKDGKCFIGVGRLEHESVNASPVVVREESVRKRSNVAGIANSGNICAPEIR